jgi:hypothetical protein
MRQAAVAKPHWPYLPVCVCGTHTDQSADSLEWAAAFKEMRTFARTTGVIEDGDEFSDAGNESAEGTTPDSEELMRRCLKLVLRTFNECLEAVTLSVSTGTIENLGDMLRLAVGLVGYPIHPLWDSRTDTLTPDFDQACRRIFRILDHDRDGLISVDEYAQYQISVFGMYVEGSSCRVHYRRPTLPPHDLVVAL